MASPPLQGDNLGAGKQHPLQLGPTPFTGIQFLNSAKSLTMACVEAPEYSSRSVNEKQGFDARGYKQDVQQAKAGTFPSSPSTC